MKRFKNYLRRSPLFVIIKIWFFILFFGFPFVFFYYLFDPFAYETNYDFLMLSYEEGNIVFHFSGDYKFTSLPVNYETFTIVSLGMFTPDNKHEFWSIQSDDNCGNVECMRNECMQNEFPKIYSNIIYGKVPKCYHEVTPANKLIKGNLFRVVPGGVPTRFHWKTVVFVVDDCREIGIKGCQKKVNSEWKHRRLKFAGCNDNAEKSCLFTNSTALWEFEEKY